MKLLLTVMMLASLTLDAQVVVGRGRRWPPAPKPRFVRVVAVALPPDLAENLDDAIKRWNLAIGDRIKLERGDAPSGEAYVRVSEHYSWSNASQAAPGYIGKLPHPVLLVENASPAAIVHELGHVFGLQHAHNHCLRDDYIDIGLTFPFGQNSISSCEPGEILAYTLPGRPYDFKSVMHYPDSDDSGVIWKPKRKGREELERLGLIDGKIILVGPGVKDGTLAAQSLSEEDVRSLREMYP